MTGRGIDPYTHGQEVSGNAAIQLFSLRYQREYAEWKATSETSIWTVMA